MRPLIVVGPSGVGKGTIINHLISRNPRMELTISYTTRQKRGNEVNGIHYHFISQ